MKVPLDIRNVPRPVVSHVTNDAGLRNMSVNDVIEEIVCAHYGIPFEPSGYPYVGSGDVDHWNLRFPVVVRDALRAHARAVGGTMTGALILILSQKYGLATNGAGRRTGRPGLDPAVVAEARRRNADGESVRSLARELGIARGTLTKALNAGGA